MSDHEEFEVIYSPLCQEINEQGFPLDIQIYGDGNGKWILEVVDVFNNSTVWDEPFATDAEALAEVHRTIADEGVESLVGKPSASVIENAVPRMGLSESELDELDDFLSSDLTPETAMGVTALDGYLTAIVSGPVAVMPSQWLPFIWDEEGIDSPSFESTEQASHITTLLIRHMNSIIANLNDLDGMPQLVLDEYSTPEHPDEFHPDGEMWAYGYVMAIKFQKQNWAELFDSSEGMEAFYPIRMLGDDDISDEDFERTNTPEQREALTKQLAESAAWIYQFWQPYREAMTERFLASATYQREHPKVGRNDPCPCGSGKKFKKCCGGGQVLH